MAVMHGANAPLLQKMIEKEIRRERQDLKGKGCRETISLEVAVPSIISDFFDIFWLFLEIFEIFERIWVFLAIMATF